MIFGSQFVVSGNLDRRSTVRMEFGDPVINFVRTPHHWPCSTLYYAIIKGYVPHGSIFTVILPHSDQSGQYAQFGRTSSFLCFARSSPPILYFFKRSFLYSKYFLIFIFPQFCQSLFVFYFIISPLSYRFALLSARFSNGSTHSRCPPACPNNGNDRRHHSPTTSQISWFDPSWRYRQRKRWIPEKRCPPFPDSAA